MASSAPVTPAAHYFMGGVAVDLDGRTSLPGLFYRLLKTDTNTRTLANTR